MLGPDVAVAALTATLPSTLESSYQHCFAIARRHSKTFSLSSRFLGHHQRRAVWAVYAFCRTADDIVDRSTPGPERLAAIDAWEAQLRDAYIGRATDPVYVAYADAIARFDLPMDAALDLLRGARMDITVSRYASYAALREYCYLVASTVGVLVMPILGTLDAAAHGNGVALGHAMQMTNILRDVGEDARMNRIYLPADEMARFGYAESDLFAGRVDTRFVALMEFQIARARALYREAEPGIERLQPASRYAVRLALNLYRAILDAIEANGYDVFTKRAYVPLSGKIVTALNVAMTR